MVTEYLAGYIPLPTWLMPNRKLGLRDRTLTSEL